MRNRGHHLADFIQLTGRAGQSHFGGGGGNAVQGKAIGNGNAAGIGGNGQCFFADGIKHNIHRLRAEHRQFDAHVGIIGVGDAGLQPQGGFARPLHAVIDRVNHNIGAGQLADQSTVAVRLHLHVIHCLLVHNIQPFGGINGRLVAIIHADIFDDKGTLRIQKGRNHHPDQHCGQHGNNSQEKAVIPNGTIRFAHRFSGLRLFLHACQHLLCSAAGSTAAAFALRLFPAE